MKAQSLLADVARWRWAPCLGLVGASLLYVVFVVAVIPNKFESQLQGGTKNRRGSAQSYADSPGSDAPGRGRTLTSTMPTDLPFSDAREEREPSSRRPVATSQPTAQRPVRRRGFSPPLERPEPPPPPPPMPSGPPQGMAVPPPLPPAASAQAAASASASVSAAEMMDRAGRAAAARAMHFAGTGGPHNDLQRQPVSSEDEPSEPDPDAVADEEGNASEPPVEEE